MKHQKSKLTAIILMICVLLAACTVKEPATGDQRRMPGGTAPEKLIVLDIPADMSWADRNMIACFQGLVNRNETRIYLNETEDDQFWLDYYRDEFGIPYEKVNSMEQLIKQFSGEIDGYILYPNGSPHLLNVATTIGALKNLLPAVAAQEKLLQRAGLKRQEKLTDNGEDMISIYRNAAQTVLSECNQQMLAAFCLHEGHWPTSTWRNRDYAMAHQVFCHDLSSSERDKSDYYLLKEIYGALAEEAIVFGWHCVRDKEHEAIGLASEYGHYGMCSLHTPNLTVHSSIPIDRSQVFRQREVDREALTLEDKVYVAYMATDGDATWFMLNHMNNDWKDPARGKMKYNWGFLPLAFDLMPGTVKYYLENCKPEDYFVCGPSGATYTYPFLHPSPEKFLELSDEYMKKCGLTTVHMTNWNDRDWWQEVELPGFHEKLQETMPDAVGYVRGMGESAFEEHFIGDGNPYIFCGEGIHRGDDVYQVMKDFIGACPNRPLFIYNLVNHSVPMGEVKAAMDKFPEGEVEMVHLDELLLLADKAFEEGRITADLYPEKSGLKKILAKEAKQKWPGFVKELEVLEAIANGNEEKFKTEVAKLPIGLERIVPGDFLAFNTIWHSMTLVKLALESKGIYVNHKPTAVKDFMKEFGHLKEAEVIPELQLLWENWHNETPTYKEAQALLHRLVTLSDYNFDSAARTQNNNTANLQPATPQHNKSLQITTNHNNSQ